MIVGQSAVNGRKSNENLVSAVNDRIRVCVRKRPLNRKESARNEQDITIVKGRKSLIMNEPKSKVDLTKYIEQAIWDPRDVMFGAEYINREQGFEGHPRRMRDFTKTFQNCENDVHE